MRVQIIKGGRGAEGEGGRGKGPTKQTIHKRGGRLLSGTGEYIEEKES